MNKFHTYNNATVVLNDEFIFDPWLYGKLYNNSWHPYGLKTLKKSKLKKIKYCFISHLHTDHWDIETIKYLPKSVIFIIPKLKTNKIIEKILVKNNYKQIIYAPIKKFVKINDKYSLSVVRPLNNEGLETKNIIYQNKGTEIDTGVIIKTKNDNSNHLLLSDNSPYNLKGFINDYSKLKFKTVFFPFNGYASDYPFCYDDLSVKEKKAICANKIRKLTKKNITFFKYIKPDLLIPYSSQFELKNKNEKKFKSIIDLTFFDKKKYVKFFNNNFPDQNIIALTENDTLYSYKKNFHVEPNNAKNLESIKHKIVKPNFPKIKSNYDNDDLLEDLNISIKSWLLRIQKYKLDLNQIYKTNFYIKVNKYNKTFKVDFKNQVCNELKNSKYKLREKYLKLKIDFDILVNILNRKLHINNCTIGFCLNWERIPNEYNSELYDSLNFFHK